MVTLDKKQKNLFYDRRFSSLYKHFCHRVPKTNDSLFSFQYVKELL